MPFIPVGRRPLAYIDTETTGLNPHQHDVIDIAVVFDREQAALLQIPHLTVQDDVAFYSTKIKPVNIDAAEPKALQVNGYTDEAWASAPTVDEVVPVLQEILKDVVCVGHNVNFDVEFIQSMIRGTGSKMRMDYHKVDTVTLAYEHLVPAGLEKLSLDTIRDFLGWPKDGGHAALFDALTARRLYKLLQNGRYLRYQKEWVEISTL